MYAEFDKKKIVAKGLKEGELTSINFILQFSCLAHGRLKNHLCNQKSIFILTRDKDGISVLEFIVLIYRNSTCLLYTI